MPSNERSAEWLRGAVGVLDLPAIRPYVADWLVAEYRTLLAAAEAREASQPTAVQRPPLGKPLDAALRCCDQLTAQLATAEEVIAACKQAFDAMPFPPHLRFCQEAIAKIAAWEAARR